MKIRVKYVRPWGHYNHCNLWRLPYLVFIRHIVLFGRERDKLSFCIGRKSRQGSAGNPRDGPLYF